MSSALQPKNERINLRLKQSAKQLLERAAGFEGESVSNFILSSALAASMRFNRKLLVAFEEHDCRVKQLIDYSQLVIELRYNANPH